MRHIARMKEDLGVEPLPRFGDVLYRMDGSCTFRQAGTFLMD
jgi:hypothetical protein